MFEALPASSRAAPPRARAGHLRFALSCRADRCRNHQYCVVGCEYTPGCARHDPGRPGDHRRATRQGPYCGASTTNTLRTECTAHFGDCSEDRVTAAQLHRSPHRARICRSSSNELEHMGSRDGGFIPFLVPLIRRGRIASAADGSASGVSRSLATCRCEWGSGGRVCGRDQWEGRPELAAGPGHGS